MPKKLLFFLFVIVFLVVLVVFWPEAKKQESQPAINSFEECAAAGYPIMESYPEQCSTPNGRIFVNSVVKEN